MNTYSSIGIGLCLLWLIGHAGSIFYVGGFKPTTTMANVFVGLDFLVSIALAFFIYKQKDEA